MALRISLLKTSNIFRNLPITTRNISSKDERIVLTKDGTTFVAWHQKQDFPYEYTRPIPERAIEESNTVLRTVMSPELKQIFKTKTPDAAREELMNITHTTKHRWFPRSRDKRAKKTVPDREYL